VSIGSRAARTADTEPLNREDNMNYQQFEDTCATERDDADRSLEVVELPLDELGYVAGGAIDAFLKID
jgi:hypothetical protein